MNQPFEAVDDNTRITGACIVDADRFTGVGLGLPEDFGKDAQEKAGLLERRLSRLELALNLDPLK